MDIGETVQVTTRAAWRAWLERHHATAREIWFIYNKKASGKPSVAYGDAVEEALCYGWIDSTVKTLDPHRYAQRFTPRKAGSNWSAPNLERVARLVGLHLINNRTAFRIGIGQAPEMAVEMALDLAFGLRQKPEVPFVAGNAGDGAQGEGTCIKQRIQYALRGAQFRDATLGPREVFGFFARGVFQRVFRRRIARGKRLPLIQGLRTDFASMIHAHQRGRCAALRVVERRIHQCIARHVARGLRGREQRAQAFVKADNEFIEVNHAALSCRFVMPFWRPHRYRTDARVPRPDRARA